MLGIIAEWEAEEFKSAPALEAGLVSAALAEASANVCAKKAA